MLTIDCDYLFPRYAASYLLKEGRSAAFIENNTAHAVPHLLAGLKKEGFAPEQVEYLIITHVHLDHAGGSSALLKACPNATLLAHPRAAKHIIDPSRLVASAKHVYGEKRFEELYGVLEPVPSHRVREIQDGETIRWGSREWHFFYTRGHANHHFCVWDSALQGVFTGDAFGLQYPDLQSGGRWIFPSTSPTDFDADEARESIDKITSFPGDRAFLTHFGEIHDLKTAARDLKAWIDFSEEVLENAARLTGQEALDAIQEKLDTRFQNEALARNLGPKAWELTRLDRELNAAGLAYAAAKAKNA